MRNLEIQRRNVPATGTSKLADIGLNYGEIVARIGKPDETYLKGQTDAYWSLLVNGRVLKVYSMLDVDLWDVERRGVDKVSRHFRIGGYSQDVLPDALALLGIE